MNKTGCACVVNTTLIKYFSQVIQTLHFNKNLLLKLLEYLDLRQCWEYIYNIFLLTLVTGRWPGHCPLHGWGAAQWQCSLLPCQSRDPKSCLFSAHFTQTASFEMSHFSESLHPVTQMSFQNSHLFVTRVIPVVKLERLEYTEKVTRDMDIDNNYWIWSWS